MMKKPGHVQAEKRRPERRVSTLVSGVIVTLDGSAEYDCGIRDLSDSGARVGAPNGATLPDDFYLMHVKDRTAYRAKVVWRFEQELRTFCYYGMAIGTAVSVAGALAENDLTQRYELAAGLTILMLSLVAFSFLNIRGPRRRRRQK